MDNGFEQIPFGTGSFDPGDFADNPEPRCPCLLILDTSGSMAGSPIRELNAGLAVFKDELVADDLAAKRVEVAVVTFGPVQVAAPFRTADEFQPPTLTAQSDTPMGAAIRTGLDLLQQRKDEIRSAGVFMYRPWVFLITDGGPTDEWRAAAEAVHAGEGTKAFSFFAVGVQGANMDVLRQIATREPLRLDGLRFRDMFVWLSASMRSVSESNPGDAVPLSNPATPSGWASV